jgi:hypothetical protein
MYCGAAFGDYDMKTKKTRKTEGADILLDTVSSEFWQGLADCFVQFSESVNLQPPKLAEPLDDFTYTYCGAAPGMI